MALLLKLYSLHCLLILVTVVLASTKNPQRNGCFNNITTCVCDEQKFFMKCQGLTRILPFPPSIKTADFSYNIITNLTRSDFVNIGHVTELSLNSNDIYNIDVDTFRDFKNLTYLDLSNNNLKFLDRDTFSHNLKLKELRLNNNRNLTFSTLGLPESLEYINLRKTASVFSVDQLANFPRLRVYQGNICVNDYCSREFELRYVADDKRDSEETSDIDLNGIQSRTKVIIATESDCITFVWISIALLLAIYLMGLVILLVWMIKQKGICKQAQGGTDFDYKKIALHK